MQNLIAPIWIEDASSAPGTVVVRWENRRDMATGEGPIYRVFVDGVYSGETVDTQLVVSGLTYGVPYQFDVLEIDPASREFLTDVRLFAIPANGRTLLLSWPAIDLAANPDFKSFLLYWNQGTDDDPTTLLKELAGANNNSYATGQLEDGQTYRFALKLADFIGNVSSLGATTVATVNTIPQAPATSSIAYDAATRVATITFTAPDDQDEDVVGYALYSNMLPGYGLADHLLAEREYRLQSVGTAGTTFTFRGLSIGQWVFAVRAYDASGLESPYDELQLNLVLDDDGALASTFEPPLAQIADAFAFAGGRIRIVIDIAEAAGSNVYVWLDGATAASTPVIDGQTRYTITTDPLTDGHEYIVQASGEQDGTYSALSDEWRVVVDSSAPSGDQTIMAELIK